MAFDFDTLGERIDALDNLKAGNPRGRGLEDIVVEILESLPGVKLGLRNVLDSFGEGELDSTWVNDAPAQGLTGFGRDFIVECKSSDTPLNSAGVGHFAGHAEDRGILWSIIFALSGISGDEDTSRHAQQTIRKFAKRKNWIMVIDKVEFRALRSVDHLLAVIAAKQVRGVAKLAAVKLTPGEVAQLDPNKGIMFNRGWESVERLIRREEERTVDEILDAVGADAGGMPAAKSALAAADQDHDDWLANSKADPFMHGVRPGVLTVGAAFAALLEEDLADKETRRIVRFDVRTSGPRKMAAHVGDELWTLLTGYYVGKIDKARTDHARRSAVMAVLALVLEELTAIDNIDPADFHDDFDEYYG